MATVQDFCLFVEAFAPTRLAEDWDNVGLLLGDRARTVSHVMACLTVTPESVREAVTAKVDLIVTHHPMPFRPLKRITSDTVVGRMMMQLLEHKIAVYSPHTSFDSGRHGINQRLAEGLGLTSIQPLEPRDAEPDGLGAGRVGNVERDATLGDLANLAKQFLHLRTLRYVGSLDRPARRVAVSCGSGGEFLQRAIQVGSDVLLTGETSFHTCLEAQAQGVALLLPGHYASERFAVELLANVLQEEFSNVNVWASREESDPIFWM